MASLYIDCWRLRIISEFSFVCNLQLLVHWGLCTMVDDYHTIENVRASVVLSFNVEMILFVLCWSCMHCSMISQKTGLIYVCIHVWIDWLSFGLTSRLTQKTDFRRRFASQSLTLVLKKQLETQLNRACTSKAKDAITQNKHVWCLPRDRTSLCIEPQDLCAEWVSVLFLYLATRDV